MASQKPLSKNSASYAAKMKAIKPYVDFNFKGELNKQQKTLITKYFKEVDSLTSRPNYVYRPRNKSNLKAVQHYAHANNTPRLKVAFVQVADEEFKPKIKVTKKGVFVKEKYVHTQFVELDKKKLIKNAERHIKAELKNAPNANSFNVVAGDHEILEYKSRSGIVAHVTELMERYSNEEQNNYFANWLRGLRTHTFDSQASQDEYVKTKMKSRDKKARQQKASKNKAYKQSKKTELKAIEKAAVKDAAKNLNNQQIKNTIKKLQSELTSRQNAKTIPTKKTKG
jgi:hypothetical protein